MYLRNCSGGSTGVPPPDMCLQEGADEVELLYLDLSSQLFLWDLNIPG